MTGRVRMFVIAGSIAAVIAAALVAGLIFLDGSPKNPSGSKSPSATPLEVSAEVERAYLEYWDVRGKAFLELDASLLDRVLTGSALEVAQQLLEDQRQKNQPIRIRVEHNYRIVIADETTASVDDRLISHSVRLDAKTMEPIEPDPNESIHNSYTLRKVGGKWKVAEIIGIEPSPSL